MHVLLSVYIGGEVLMGGTSGLPEIPTVGNNVYISAGAKISGDVRIGNGATIGANSVVVKNTPCGETWAGVPAKRLKQ
jgi:serine O-acetyltransferase